MSPRSEAEQWQHRVMHSDQMAPQINEPIFSRSHLGEQLLFVQAGEQLVRSFQVQFQAWTADATTDCSGVMIVS